MRLLSFLILLLSAISCTGDLTPVERSKTRSIPKSEEVKLDLTSTSKINIVCYGYSDPHVKQVCDEGLKWCQQKYGKSRCRVLKDPTCEKVSSIPEGDIVIVVGHMTPTGMSPDLEPTAPYDIWHTPNPPSCHRPGTVFWSCYAADYADPTNGIIPVNPIEGCTKDDETNRCRATAILECLKSGVSPQNMTELQACVERRCGAGSYPLDFLNIEPVQVR